MRRTLSVLFAAAALVWPAVVPTTGPAGSAAARRPPRALPADPVITWSTQARRAIVPAGPAGVFGAENYGTKFPGEAAVYMGIVHAAMYDTAVALTAGGDVFAVRVRPDPLASAPAAIATVAHDVLVGLQPALGLTPTQQAVLDGEYTAYLATVPDGPVKSRGIELGRRVAAAELGLRVGDGRDADPTPADLGKPPPGPGVWEPGAGPALGLRMPGIRPLGLPSGSMFRPAGPTPLAGARYARDLAQVASLGRSDSATRTTAQTAQALFWTDHDLRQWNDGMLRLAQDRHLGLRQTARMLAMAHVSGGDAMIACFDAKYHYWFWRPAQAIPLAGADGNPATEADPAWQPLRATPPFPEYPSAHACHSAAVVQALQAFFGTDAVPLTLDSRVTGTATTYRRLRDVVTDVTRARVLVGFHFLHSDLDGAALGRRVACYDLHRYFGT